VVLHHLQAHEPQLDAGQARQQDQRDDGDALLPHAGALRSRRAAARAGSEKGRASPAPKRSAQPAVSGAPESARSNPPTRMSVSAATSAPMTRAPARRPSSPPRSASSRNTAAATASTCPPTG